MKKTSTKSTVKVSPNSNPIPKKPFNMHMRGFFYLTIAILLFLSLVSFGQGHAAQNWLGLLGYFLGWCLHILFGITSYLIPLFLGWMGWRGVFGKIINHPRLKVLYFCTLVISAGMLLTLLEDHYPQGRNAIRSVFYPHLNPRNVLYHLGGSPLYFLYHDLPIFNLQRLFNITGVAIVFSGAFIASFFFLFKRQMLHMIRSIFPKQSSTSPEESPQESEFHGLDPNLENKQPIPKPENSFMRYVKLRMGGGSSSQSNANTNSGNTSGQHSSSVGSQQPGNPLFLQQHQQGNLF